MKKYHWLIVIGWIITIFFTAHFGFLYGILKERERKICIDAVTIRKFDQTLDTAKAICVDMAKQQLDVTKAQNIEQKKNADYWRKKYEEVSTTTHP